MVFACVFLIANCIVFECLLAFDVAESRWQYAGGSEVDVFSIKCSLLVEPKHLISQPKRELNRRRHLILVECYNWNVKIAFIRGWFMAKRVKCEKQNNWNFEMREYVMSLWCSKVEKDAESRRNISAIS